MDMDNTNNRVPKWNRFSWIYCGRHGKDDDLYGIIYIIWLLGRGGAHSSGLIQQRSETGIFLAMVLMATHTHTPPLSLLYPLSGINWMSVITPYIKTNNKSSTYFFPFRCFFLLHMSTSSVDMNSVGSPSLNIIQSLSAFSAISVVHYLGFRCNLSPHTPLYLCVVLPACTAQNRVFC